jgi:hypothetical protein
MENGAVTYARLATHLDIIIIILISAASNSRRITELSKYSHLFHIRGQIQNICISFVYEMTFFLQKQFCLSFFGFTHAFN